MLSEEIKKLEEENKRLKVLVGRIQEGIPRPKNCENCKNYIQHYGRDSWGTYYKIYRGHCRCDVPVKKRKGKSVPTPEDTCLCFEERRGIGIF